MKKYFSFLFKSVRFVIRYVRSRFEYVICRIIFIGNRVNYKKFVSNGIPFVSVALNGKCVIGNNFSMNNGLSGNPIGRVQKCILFVDNGAELIIGDDVGMSSTALVANTSIRIGNHVKMGGGVCIYDTDFHSLDPKLRRDKLRDKTGTKKKPVIIEDNVFIGAHSTILKGVVVGRNSIIGACSVVTKSIPENEIWGGNPARFIKKIYED